MVKLLSKFAAAAVAVFFGASCSSVNKLAVNSASQVMQKGSNAVNYEQDWELFKAGAPGNIMMIEGMSHANPENENLLAMLAKAYGGYAYGVHETLYLDDFLSGRRPQGEHKKRAVISYSKAFNYGLKYLELNGIDKSAVHSNDAAKRLPELFDSRLDAEDMSAVFFTGQALGGLINLQKNNVALLGKIGAAKAMMDWVCERDMEFEAGSCHLFYAVYEASRPPMMGGSLERAKKIFLDYMKRYPHNLLGRTAYLQYYVVPMMDEVEYARQREILLREFAAWEKAQNAGAGGEEAQEYRKHSRFNLYNAIALKRFKIIEKNKENIF